MSFVTGYRATISAPHMVSNLTLDCFDTTYIVICAHDYFPIILIEQHAHALELLSDKLTEGASALDVGSGSGYLTACFARMVSYLVTI